MFIQCVTLCRKKPELLATDKNFDLSQELTPGNNILQGTL